ERRARRAERRRRREPARAGAAPEQRRRHLQVAGRLRRRPTPKDQRRTKGSPVNRLLRQLSIRQRLMACVALVSVLILALGAWMQWSARSAVSGLEALIAQERAMTGTVSALRQSIARVKQNELGMIVSAGNTNEVERYKGLWEAELKALDTGFN